jgi:DNA-binding FadR family transcriptional regulator
MMTEALSLSDPIEAAKGVQRVFAALRARLLAGAFKAGDRLPAERELALSLGVSRPVLREALRALAALGFIEIRHGSGAYVRQPDISAAGDVLTFCMAQQPDVLDDVVQARIAIECQAIRLACERASDADLARIGASLTALTETLDDPERGARADHDFHLGIVKASRSATLLVLYRALGELLLRSHVERRRVTVTAPGIRNYLVDAHREVFISIVDREPNHAEAQLREHFAIGDEFRRKSLIAAYRQLRADTETKSQQGEATQ